MKDNLQRAKTVVQNFWTMILALSMVGLAIYNIYQARESLSAIGVQVLVVIAASIVVVEGVIQLIKFLSRR